MAKSYKLSGTGNYIDASGVSYEKKELPYFLDNLEKHRLYLNESGSSGTITLSQSVANYDFIFVFFTNNNKMEGSQEFYKPNGKQYTLDSYYLYSSGSDKNIVAKYHEMTANGTSLTRNMDYEVIFLSASGGKIIWNGESANTSIIEVLGFNDDVV